MGLKSELLERDDDIDDLKQQLQKAEAIGQELQEKAAEEVSTKCSSFQPCSAVISFACTNLLISSTSVVPLSNRKRNDNHLFQDRHGTSRQAGPCSCVVSAA